MERFARKVQEVQKLLQHPHTDWKDASSAIEELATGVETLRYTDNYQDAVRLLVGVSSDIGVQIGSIRSRLVKDVCLHLLRIVTVTGRDFQDLANALLPQIINTAKSSSAAVRQPGSKLLCKVSELVRYDVSLMRKMFGQLTQEKARVLLLEQLRIIFVFWSDEEVMAWESDVLEMIRQGVDDQNETVRKEAREVLIRFSSRWNERVDELMDILTPQAKVLVINEHRDSPLAATILEKTPELLNKADALARSRRSSFLDRRSSFQKSPRHKREHSIEIHTPLKQQDTMTLSSSGTEMYTHSESAQSEGVAVSRHRFVDTNVSNLDDDNEEDNVSEAFDGSQMHHSKSTTTPAATLPFESKEEELSSLTTAISSQFTVSRSQRASSVEEELLQHPSVKKLQELKIPSPLNQSHKLLSGKRFDSPSSATNSPELRPSLLPLPGSFTLKARGSNGPSTPISAAIMDKEYVELKPLRGAREFMTVGGVDVEDEKPEEKLLSASDEYFSKPIPSSTVTPTAPPPPTDNVTLRPKIRAITRQELESRPLQERFSETPQPELPRFDEPSVTETVSQSIFPSKTFINEAPLPPHAKGYSSYTDEVDDLYLLTEGSDHGESDNEWDHGRLDDIQSQSAEESDAESDGVDQVEHGDGNSSSEDWRHNEELKHNFDSDDEVANRVSEDQTDDVPPYEYDTIIATDVPQARDMDWLEQNEPSSPERHLAMLSESEKEFDEDKTTTGNLPKDALEALLNVRNQMTRLRAITSTEEDTSQISHVEGFTSKPLPLGTSSTAEESPMEPPAKPFAQQWEEPMGSSYLERLNDADYFEHQGSPTYAPLEQTEEINFLGQEGGRNPLEPIEQDLMRVASADAAEEVEEQNFFAGLQARSPRRPQMISQAARADALVPEPFDFMKEPHPAKAHNPLPEEHAKTVQGHEPFLNHGQAGRFDAAERMFAVNKPISTHGYYDRPDAPKPDSYMHPEVHRVRAPPTPMGEKMNSAYGNTPEDVTTAVGGNDEAENEDAYKVSSEKDFKKVLSKLSQPVPSFLETVETSAPSENKPDSNSDAPSNAAHPAPEPLTSEPRSAAPTKLGWASSFGITAVVFLAAMFCMAGIMRAAKKVHDSHEYHLALKSRIDMFEASIAESHDKVLKLEEDYVIWSEYVRKLTEEDEVNALTQLEAIQLEVQKWQQEMKADLVEFRQALSVDSINAAFASFRVNNTPQIEQ